MADTIKKANYDALMAHDAQDILYVYAVKVLMEERSIKEDTAKTIVDKIIQLLISSEDTRFTMYDYVDAIAHTSYKIVPEKIASLNGDNFETVMIGLAAQKRQVYIDGCPTLEDTILHTQTAIDTIT